jgi:hypothetical protein
LISHFCGFIIYLCACTALFGRASKESRGVNGIRFAVKMFTTIRESLCKRRHVYALAVTLMALGLFVQAVHAKNSDYFPKTAQTVRFSTTVKIADLAEHVVVVNPATVSSPREVLPLTQPGITRAAFIPEIVPKELSEQISFRPLRSPPVNS